MADRIVVMSKGKIEQLGTPLEIYNTPGNPVRRRLLRHADHEFSRGYGRGRTAPPRFRGAGPRAGAARFGAANRQLEARSCWACARSMWSIDASAPAFRHGSPTEPLGDATLVHFDYGQGKSLVAKVPPTTTLGPGVALKFRFAPEHCHLFDAAGGARLN